MKKARAFLICLVLAALNLPIPAASAVTFAITPPAVSNTYSGWITLTISGLSPGGSVVVQKYLDLNNNGVIDGNDLLVQQFSLTDGQPGMVIGGVTNFNVPGDMDGATNGQITANLNFQSGDFIQNVVGNYLYKVSGDFPSPATNTLTVTNFPWGQNFSGCVFSNATPTVVSNACVMLLSSKHAVAGTLADNSGVYAIQAPAGAYQLFAFRSNYVGDFAGAPTVALASGASVATNLVLTAATASISGTLVEAGNSSLGLPGVMIPAQSTGGLMGISFTDTNGNFAMGVLSGQWKIKGNDTALLVQGCLGLQNGTNVSAGTSNLIIAVPKATALIYGSVQDNLGNPLDTVDIYAGDNNNRYQTDGYTDPNGNYVVGVLAVGSGDSWGMQASGNNALTNYVFSQESISGNVNANQAELENFVAIPATNLISGCLKDNQGNPISGVGIWANATINGGYFEQDTETDNNGNYSLNVANSNSWSVGVNTCSDCSDGLPGDYLSPGNQTVAITNNSAGVNFTALLTTNFITGHVQQSNGNPISGVGVWAGATINNVGYGQYVDTDDSGDYSLNVANGNWTVALPCGSDGFDGLGDILGAGTYLCPDSQTAVIDNSNATNNFTVQTCAGLQILTTSLPPGEVNVYYDQFVEASGCTPTLTWGLLSGPLPPGLAGNAATGEIFGTPTNAGSFSFTVQVADGNGLTTNQVLSVTIFAPVQVMTTSLANGTNGLNYSQQLQAVAGVPFGRASPYSWSLAFGSAGLPANLTLATNGLLSGTPATNGTFNFSVEVADALGGTAGQSLSLIINPSAPPLQVTTTSLPNGTNGILYAEPLQYSGGQAPVHWSLSPGSAGLPPNLTLTTNGLISGTLATNGTFSFIVRVTDTTPTNADAPLSLMVIQPPLQITTGSLLMATQNVDYTATLLASGGQPPYTWSLAPGSASLPAGLTLTTNGIVRGKPVNRGTNYFIVRVTDADADWLNQLLALTVAPSTNPPAVSITAAAALANGQFQFTFNTTAGSSYTIQVSTDLTHWSSLLTLGGSGAPLTITDLGAGGNGRRFYRVEIEP